MMILGAYLCLISIWFADNILLLISLLTGLLILLQDQGLDVISEGLDTLKNMAHDMNEVGCCLLYMPDIMRDFGITSLLHLRRNWTGKSL